MKTHKLLVTGLSLAALYSPLTLAEEAPQGEQLHNDNCLRCHSTDVYTREDRKVQSLEGLGKRVRMCKNNLSVTWFDDEVNSVIEYLNQSFYKFETK